MRSKQTACVVATAAILAWPGRDAAAAADDEFSIEDAVRSCAIERTVYTDQLGLNLYQGNGAFGGCYGPLGLHRKAQPYAIRQDLAGSEGNTRFTHVSHWFRGKFGGDYLMPLAWIYWQDELAQGDNYRQHQSFDDGTITTHFEDGPNKVTVTTWFDPVEDSLGGITIDLVGSAPDVVLRVIDRMLQHYSQEVVQTAAVSVEGDLAKLEITCLTARSTLYARTNAALKADGNGVRLRMREGRTTILLSVNRPPAATPQESRERTAAWWHAFWNRAGMLVLPDPEAQKFWVRSVAGFYSTFNAHKTGLPTMCGLSGNGWPYYTPQDFAYIHPVLLATGGIEIVKTWIEYWGERVPEMKAYTNRLFKTDGIMFPWVFPYGDFAGYHDPAPPNKFFYEIHNSGYLARMAHETALGVDDPAWTARYVAPIIAETAKFYLGMCHKQADGYWHIQHTPSMGQDEMGGENQEDYLCALFSAKYCFQRAVEYGFDADGTFATILREGLAFPALMSEAGFYFANRGTGESDVGGQKHPVQLNDLALLPLGRDIEEPSRIAHLRRYEITHGAARPTFHGWTGGEFALASSRAGLPQEWRRDWAAFKKSGYIDPDMIQVYETPRTHRLAFYFPTAGLITQSFVGNVVCDWFGRLEIARCNPWDGTVRVKDLCSLLGVTVSGRIDAATASLRLVAWKHCRFEIHGETIALGKGQTVSVELDLRGTPRVRSVAGDATAPGSNGDDASASAAFRFPSIR